MKLLVALILMIWPLAVTAQSAPRLETTVDETDVIPGQPIVLRVKVLVPTWMPSPPVYPDLEQPNLMVRLPERATSPVSETIDGDTWSGTSRTYRLYPLEAGTYQIEGKILTITYADPDGSEPVTVELELDPVTLTATIPDSAKDLSPFIAASGFDIEQTLEGVPDGDMQVGDALTRTLSAKIDGTTPVMIPNLLPRPDEGPLRAYPDEPRVAESENRGVLSGTRTERVSYVAQTGGQAELPEITIQWYNLDRKKVETITLPGSAITIAAPPAPPPDSKVVALWLCSAMAAFSMLWLIWRRVGPVARRWRSERHAAWLASEPCAAKAVTDAIRDRQLSDVYAALDDWQAHYPKQVVAMHQADLAAKMQCIGAALYAEAAQNTADWSAVEPAFQTMRAAVKTSGQGQNRLPPLNPV